MSRCWTSLPFLLKAEPLRLRLVVTRLSRRWSSLDDDDELELDDDDELDELERDPDDELLSDELKKLNQNLLLNINDFVVVVVHQNTVHICVVMFDFNIKIFILYFFLLPSAWAWNRTTSFLAAISSTVPWSIFVFRFHRRRWFWPNPIRPKITYTFDIYHQFRLILNKYLHHEDQIKCLDLQKLRLNSNKTNVSWKWMQISRLYRRQKTQNWTGYWLIGTQSV